MSPDPSMPWEPFRAVLCSPKTVIHSFFGAYSVTHDAGLKLPKPETGISRGHKRPPCGVSMRGAAGPSMQGRGGNVSSRVSWGVLEFLLNRYLDYRLPG